MDALAGLMLLLNMQTALALVGGVSYGLVIGIIPGLGGGTALALLLPITIGMEPSVAFATIVGLMAVNTTSDTIPAVLFGVPGTSGSAATVLDGHAMAKQGRAKEALGASYVASMIGGVFGAILLGISIPLIGRLIPLIGTPELLAVCILGLSFAASVSGRNIVKGLSSACFGLLIAFVGQSSQTAEERWTFGSLYFWDGVPLLPLILGLFAVPALAELIHQPMADEAGENSEQDDSILRGVAAAGRHWFLILRSSWIGAALGAIPGIGGSIVDWVAYASAVRTERDPEKFGTGDVRGVIAPEGSNNAKDGGALIPTLTLGVPGTAGMALVLAALVIHGITPGPQMLREHGALTYMLVWGLMIANIVGAGICLLFTRHLAMILKLAPQFLVPAIATIMFMGAFQGSQSLGDLWLLLGAGVVAFFLKSIDWPLPPLVLGFILGEIIERYLFISLSLYGWAWVFKPVPLAILLIAAFAIVRPLLGMGRGSAKQIGRGSAIDARTVALVSAVFAGSTIIVVGIALYTAAGWSAEAKAGPLIIGSVTVVLLFTVVVSSLAAMLRKAPDPDGPQSESIEKDIVLGLAVLGLMFGYIVVAHLVGMLPAILVFVPAVFLTLGGRPGLGLVLLTTGLFGFVYGLFDRLLAVPWPHPAFPDLQQMMEQILP